MKLIDLTGQVFGELEVLKRGENDRQGKVRWVCRCSCGKECLVSTGHLRSGHSKSCGHLGIEHATQAKIKHGDSLYRKVAPLYNVWNGMRQRCSNPNNPVYKWYGGKGVSVCPEWNDYAAFKAWAEGAGYEPGLSIDRIDPARGYEPGNCRWITRSENSRRAGLLSPDVQAEVDRMVRAGASKDAIIQATGVSSTVVYATRERLGIPRNIRARRMATMRECIKGLWAVGASVPIIKKALGFPATTIRRVVDELNRNATTVPAA